MLLRMLCIRTLRKRILTPRSNQANCIRTHTTSTLRVKFFTIVRKVQSSSTREHESQSEITILVVCNSPPLIIMILNTVNVVLLGRCLDYIVFSVFYRRYDDAWSVVPGCCVCSLAVLVTVLFDERVEFAMPVSKGASREEGVGIISIICTTCDTYGYR